MREVIIRHRHDRILRLGIRVALLAGTVIDVATASLINRTVHDIDISRPTLDGQVLRLDCPVTSLPGAPGAEVSYLVTLENLGDRELPVALTLERTGFESLPARVKPEAVTLAPRATTTCVLTVTVTADIAVGGQEPQVLVARTGPTHRSERLTFITVRARPHPYVLVTDDLLKEVRHKVETCSWARRALDELVRTSANWTAPPPWPREIRYDDNHIWLGLFPSASEQAWRTALAGVLLDDESLVAAAAALVRNVCDPATGYPTTRWATYSTAYVHEGEFFLYLAATYDLLHDRGVFTPDEHDAIRATLRLFLRTTEPWLAHGGISNWVVTPNAAAICTSLVLQDMTSLDRHLHGPGGFQDQITLGVMGDGWFYECTANYSYLVAEYYGMAAQACANWGFDLFHQRLPARYPRNIEKRYPNGYLGMVFDIWGPPGGNTRGLKDLYDGAIGLMDEAGNVVASNDSAEIAPGSVYEMAYRHYREPAYAWAVSQTTRSDWPSLLYGIDPLPSVADPRGRSAKADNIGIAALRSQAPGRTAADQIQAFIKWGTHGGWHGHFDRASLLALYRYGQSFYYPTVGWFGYGSPLYKAWIQPSASHNMVVVDQYQQEPVESDLLLFHPGAMMQAAVVQTRARWTQIPAWDPRNPEPAPAHAMIEYPPGMTPVLQRRLMAVTDDYVLIADYLNSDQEHTYDWLIHPVGLRALQAKTSTFVQHTSQADDNPQGSYRHILGCTWYQVETPMNATFEDGPLTLDVHVAWPRDLEVMTGTFPMPAANFFKRFVYTVRGDEKELVRGDFESDLLAAEIIDVPLHKVRRLKLTTHADPAQHWRTGKSAVWADARVETAEGDTVFLADLPHTGGPVRVGQDIEGGPVQVVGDRCARALVVELGDTEHAVTFDLGTLAATRFRATFGVDYPAGAEQDTRRTLLARCRGHSARYLVVIEPHGQQETVDHVHADGPERFTVALVDGRRHQWTIDGFEGDGHNIEVTLNETGPTLAERRETAASALPTPKEGSHELR